VELDIGERCGTIQKRVVLLVLLHGVVEISPEEMSPR
jgi:hypothetical protein